MENQTLGRGNITVECRKDGSTVATQLFATYPCRFQLTARNINSGVSILPQEHHTYEPNDIKLDSSKRHIKAKAITCYLLGYGGGLVSGDHIHIKIHVKIGASLVLTSQSTTKAFKALPNRRDTAIVTLAHIQNEGLLFLVPQPTQCFSSSRLRQETHVVMEDHISDTTVDALNDHITSSSNTIDVGRSKEPSLILVDWLTGGRRASSHYRNKNMGEDVWSMDFFGSQTTISYSCASSDNLSDDNIVFRDMVVLSGGNHLKNHMRQYNVICMVLLMGPKVELTSMSFLKKYSSRQLFEENDIGTADDHRNTQKNEYCQLNNINQGGGLNHTDGLLVSCGTFYKTIHNKKRRGVIVRIAAVSVEKAAKFLSDNIGTLDGQLQEDPFLEILASGHKSIHCYNDDELDGVPLHHKNINSFELVQNTYKKTVDPVPIVDTFNCHKIESSCPAVMLYQLSDSCAPIGSFAHSFTLEAASQLRLLSIVPTHYKLEISQHIWDVIVQTFTTTVPFLIATCRLSRKLSIQTKAAKREAVDALITEYVDEWEKIDTQLSEIMTSHVASRASVLQGSGVFRAFSHAFPHINEYVKALKKRVLKEANHDDYSKGHSSTCFGAICGMLGIDDRTTVSIFLYTTCRDMVNAAIRLNLIGPLEAGCVTFTLGQGIESLIERHMDDAGTSSITWFQNPRILSFQIAPLIEILSNAHDRLYTRLFNS